MQNDAELINKVDRGGSVTESIERAETLFAHREDVVKLREALNIIAQARDPEHRNFEAEFRFAKYSYFLSKQVTDDREIEQLLKNGYAAGLIASRMEADKPEGHFWTGACLGERSRRSPLTVGFESMDEIRELMNKVIKIRPGFQGASAFDVLAQVELGTRLMGGKPEKAIELLEKGLKYETENPYIHLHLAEAYLGVGQALAAKERIDHIFKMKENPEYMVEHREVLEKAKMLWKAKF